MDCDFSHDPKDLIRLHKVLIKDESDMVVGSRYITGVNVVNWPMSRVLLSYFASKYVRFISGFPFLYSNYGFKCFKRIVLESINLYKIHCILI